MLLLGILTFLVVAASIATTIDYRSRSEAVIASSLIGNAIVVGPVYAFGLVNRLTRASLGGSVTAISLVILAIFVRRHGKRAPGLLARRTLALLLLPIDAIRRTWRKRTVLTAGAVLATAFAPYMLLVAYLAPSWRDWDGIWYHETVIAFTIQNHGFKLIELPQGLQVVNGNQRLAEMTQLWFGIWGGRAVVDVANVFFMPLMAAAMYALTHRYTRDAVTSAATAAAIILIPGFIRLVQSTMVDPQGAALLLAAAYWATHPDFDRRAAWLAILGLTLAVGAKIWFIVPVSFFSLYLLVRIIRRRRALGPRTTLGLVGIGSLAILGMQATTYLANWINFKNPFWPFINYDNDRLGIHWKGIVIVKLDQNRAGIDFNDAPAVLVRKLLGLPYSAMVGHTWQANDYGFAWAWVVFPLMIVALAAVALRFMTRRALLGRIGRIGDEDLASAMILAFVGTVSILVSPAIYIARYHIASLGMLLGTTAWFVGRRRSRRLLEDAMLCAQLGSVVVMAWAPIRHEFAYLYDAKQIVRWLRTPYPRRELEDITTATGQKLLVAPVNYETGLAREREIRAGDVVAFDSIDYAALLWNNDFSNKVVWTGTNDPLGEANRAGAAWVYTRGGTVLANQLAKAASEWELIGPLENEGMGSVWRRRHRR